MLEDENKVLQTSVQLWNQFLQLKDLKQDHIDDFRYHVHALQAIIALRQVKVLSEENERNRNAHSDIAWQLQNERDRW